MKSSNKLIHKALNLGAILIAYWPSIGFTWLLTLIETALTALIPLLIGFAIDGLMQQDYQAFTQLVLVMCILTTVGVGRRIYDTRAYGSIKVKLSEELVERSNKLTVSRINARMEMGRELIDFLEQEVPELMTSAVQLMISVIILYTFHPFLSYAAFLTAALSLSVYALFHKRFFRLNANLNHEKENQVSVLSSRQAQITSSYLDRLRKAEVRISDTESYVYGVIFVVLIAFIAFNLWFSTSEINTSVGTIFSIISYSWEFVEALLVLPLTLQSWSRLSEIIQRINAPAQDEFNDAP